MPLFLLDVYRASLLGLNSVRWVGIYLLSQLRRSPRRLSFSYCLRRLIEAMGVTYLKLGQYLAIRYDLLPAAVCRELSNLLNEAPSIPLKAVQKVIETELGGSLEELFQSFNPCPVGSASIAQVHRARAHDGQLLAVKVQRPGAEDLLRSDIRNMLRLAWIADRFHLSGSLSMVDSVREVGDFTLREIDFIHEGRTADRVRRDAPPFVVVPQVRWDLTSRRVLVMEFIEGVSLLKVCELAEAGHPDAFERLLPGVDAHQLLESLAKACLHQLFATGVFHGDPHPANIIVRRDGRLAFVDFGIFGELDPRQRALLSALLANLAAGRLEAAFRCYLGLARVTKDTDLQRYRREMMALLGDWYRAVGAGAITPQRLAARYQMEVFQLMHRHRLRVQPDQLLFWRTLAVLDATAYRVPGRFDLLSSMNRFFRSLRPHPAQRVTRLLTDESLALSLGEHLALLPSFAAALRAPRGGEAPPMAIRHAGAAFNPKPVVLVLVAVSLAVLAAGEVGGALVSAVIGGLAFSLGLASLLRPGQTAS